ncbi:MAG TPA: peptidoglycan DD-metalloendopeptidase family protein [Gammaproteobacteria bacterium]|nr:peptidoglycan DD-metalloendopeptidase family protein [Gammaproteobacteria bacterium]
MRAWLVVLVLTALAACTSSLVSYEARVHVVQRGDTLSKIAWQHGLDQRQLASWNGLKNPDLIRVGQRLRLTAPAAARAPGPGSASRTTTTRPTTVPSATRRAPATLPAEPPLLPAPSWQWPTDGQVVSVFGARSGIATGIGISGRVGQSVRAAAPGRVVYAGSGLIGYGQLVIIKHNDTYLSAYGHNSRLLVTQGQDVGRGEQIAAMGLGPERQPRLHFEIRRNGLPVDPLQLLSTRR